MNTKTLIIDSTPSLGGIARLQQLVPLCLEDAERLSYVSSRKVLFRAFNLVRLYLTARVRLQRGSYVLYMHPYLARLHPYLFSKAPYGVLVHGYEIFKDDRSKLNGVFKQADTVICNSRHVYRFIQDNYMANNIVQVYYPTVEFSGMLNPKSEARDNTSPGNGVTTEDTYVLTVGRMSKHERYKGHDEIIEALPSIVERFPDTKVIFAGTGDDEARLKRKASAQGVDEFIDFKGEVSDRELAGLYKSAHIFLMPSSGEGQGLVYLEAMQFGIPVIALRNSPAQELISHNESGMLLEQKTPQEIAASVCGLLGEPAKMRQLGQAAHKRYMDMDVMQTFCSTLQGVVHGNTNPN